MKIKLLLITLFFNVNLHAVYTYSLTSMYITSAFINPLVIAEMQTIKAMWDGINIQVSVDIKNKMDKKESLTKEILNRRAINETLFEEIKVLNKEINNIILLKEGISNDLHIK